MFVSVLTEPIPSSFLTTVPPHEKDQMFSVAATQQDNIGWANLFKGHIAKSWSEIQSKHYSFMYHNPPSIYTWSTEVILHLYDVAYNMWNHHNQIVHTQVETSLTVQEAQRLHLNITHQYQLGSSSVLPMHQYMFKAPLTTLLSQSAESEKYWLLTIQASCLCVTRTSTPVIKSP